MTPVSEHEVITSAPRVGGQSIARARPIAPTVPENWFSVSVEVAARVAAGLALGIFGYAAYIEWIADPSRITLVLLVITAALSVGLSLFSKVPTKRDWSPFAVFFSVAGTFYYLLFQLSASQKIIPEDIAASIQVVGLAWQLFAKLSLRRSFGILPANRGVVSRGAYRFVRHPMYLGYLMIDVGFLLANFSVQNVLAVCLQVLLQVGRIYREERILSEDGAYLAYKAKVRYRVIPGVF
ncbi:methyltransferase family protein [Burkholderia sp. FERM BP-3421]|jgi:protein-S-isoprenylcysteine O-methyltransferase Ste14|uniref:methyltransferase family protein n=1 Tax=Burkholderia sp. FERM BP-3421 TaxID=1494466 RepID=UPI003FCC2D66